METSTLQDLDGRIKLPQQQRRVLEYIEQYVEISGYPPSISEITGFLGVNSTFGVRKHLDALVKKGFLVKGAAGLSRTVMPVSAANGQTIPIIGRVTAGQPILAVENVEGWLAFKPMDMSRKTFGLRVQGESMKDKGILDGDIVVVRQQNTAEDGEIVVALIEDSATVKTFRKKGEDYRLEPANARFKPIAITADMAFQILGKVTSVIRMIDEKRPGVFQLKFQ